MCVAFSRRELCTSFAAAFHEVGFPAPGFRALQSESSGFTGDSKAVKPMWKPEEGGVKGWERVERRKQRSRRENTVMTNQTKLCVTKHFHPRSVCVCGGGEVKGSS